MRILALHNDTIWQASPSVCCSIAPQPPSLRFFSSTTLTRSTPSCAPVPHQGAFCILPYGIPGTVLSSCAFRSVTYLTEIPANDLFLKISDSSERKQNEAVSFPTVIRSTPNTSTRFEGVIWGCLQSTARTNEDMWSKKMHAAVRLWRFGKRRSAATGQPRPALKSWHLLR